jgi:hypothetical protein
VDPVTELESQILNLERIFWKTAGAKDAAIGELGLTPMRYYQLLARLITTPAAMATDPVTVKRLQRIAHLT